MSDAFVIALCLAAVIVLAVLGNSAYRAHLRTGPASEWELRERSANGRLLVYCSRPGDGDLIVGFVEWSDPAFEDKIEQVRAEGRYKLAALNSGRTLTKGR